MIKFIEYFEYANDVELHFTMNLSAFNKWYKYYYPHFKDEELMLKNSSKNIAKAKAS